MRLELYRYSSQKDSTLGMMFLVDKENNKEFLCYTLEDEYRQNKIYGETRIPAKQYYVELRKEGGYNEKYKKRFADIHEGMLHITDCYKRIYPKILRILKAQKNLIIKIINFE
jgi:hypothetical protein